MVSFWGQIYLELRFSNPPLLNESSPLRPLADHSSPIEPFNCCCLFSHLKLQYLAEAIHELECGYLRKNAVVIVLMSFSKGVYVDASSPSFSLEQKENQQNLQHNYYSHRM